MWNNLSLKYQAGINQVRNYQKVWETIKPYMDAQRFEAVKTNLDIQSKDAVWWKDACLQYFQTFSKLPLPQGVEQPERSLEELQNIKLNLGHHN